MLSITTVVRVHLPLKQGLRLNRSKDTGENLYRTSASSIKTRIKTIMWDLYQMAYSSTSASSIKTRIKT